MAHSLNVEKTAKIPIWATKMSRVGPQDEYIVPVRTVYLVFHEVIMARFSFFRFHRVTHWSLLASFAPVFGVCSEIKQS